MSKTTAFVAAFGLISLWSFLAWGQNIANMTALASYDWSAIGAHNLASNPPPKDIVEAFLNSASGTNIGHICEFRFADLRGAGNLSLIVSIDGGGTGGCNQTAIFDKTPSGFQMNTSWAFFSSSDGIQDINHDGKHELVLWARIGPGDPGEVCSWPLVYAWTGSGYSEVSTRYKTYYERYLKTVDRLLVAEPSNEEARVPATDQKPTIVQIPPPPDVANNSSSSSSEGSAPSLSGSAIALPPPASSSVRASTAPDDVDYYCLRMTAAKAEAFLGKDSAATMTYAIKASESNDPDQRKLAAVMFSYLRTPEAKSDLKILATDSEPTVAEFAKDKVTADPETFDYYRISEEPIMLHSPLGKTPSP